MRNWKEALQKPQRRLHTLVGCCRCMTVGFLIYPGAWSEMTACSCLIRALRGGSSRGPRRGPLCDDEPHLLGDVLLFRRCRTPGPRACGFRYGIPALSRCHRRRNIFTCARRCEKLHIHHSLHAPPACFRVVIVFGRNPEVAESVLYNIPLLGGGGAAVWCPRRGV